MSKSWQEVQTLLDDPFVDADTKEHLLAAYIKENVDGYPFIEADDVPDDVRDYFDQYKLRDGDYDQGSLDDIYGDAQAESEERGNNANLTQQDIDANSSTLDGQQAPQMGNRGGVETSDDVFELARPALKVFENFLPVNDKVPGDSLGRYNKITMEDVTKRFEEQLGISFTKFIDDADRLRTAHLKLNELNRTSQAELNNLYKSWTGPAANASYQHYSEKIGPNVTDLLDYLAESPGMVETAVQNIFAECKAKADTVISLYQPTLGSATPDIAMKVVELANDAGDRDKIMEVAAWVDSVCGSNIENTIRDDDCGLNDENKEYVQRECKKWIRDSFNPDLHDYVYATFKQTCDDTLEAVDSYYEQLNDYLGEYENEFEQGGAATPPGTGTTPPGTQPGTGATPPPSTPGGSSPGTTTPSGSMPPVSTPPSTGTGPGSGPGSSPSSPSVPSVPQMPAIPTPGSSTGPAGTPGSSTTPSGVPGSGVPGTGVPGAPGSGTPGSTPAMPVIPGLPGSSTPGSGLPGSGLGTPGAPGSGLPGTSAPKEVTIQDGDRKITVGQPDAQGRSKVTIDDGKGEPREYTVDFTQDPGEQPEDGVIQAKDGKAVLHDGDADISLEQVPGPNDRLKMTVDDGTPETYDVDFGPDSKVPGVPDVPGSHLGLPDTPTPPGGSGAHYGGGGGGSVGGAGHFGGGDTPGTSTGPQPGTMVGAGSDTTGAERAAAAAASGGSAAGGGQHSGQQGAFGGMPMGGMGAGQGGDQSRQSKWRTTGQLFDDQDPAASFSGIVGRDPSDAPPVPVKGPPVKGPIPKR
jgi:hypothetical protein